MKDLIIETSLRDVSIGIYSQGMKLFQKTIEKGRGEILSDLLNDAMHETGSELKEIKRVLVTLGPGSFTGLRVGLAFAQGLCFSGNRELYGVSTLAALDTLTPREKDVVVVTRAKPNSYYVGTRSMGTPIAASLAHERIMSGEEIVSFVQSNHHVLVDTQTETDLVTALQSETIQDINLTFDLQHYTGLFDILEPLPIDKVIPNYIQEPYAK